MFFLDRVVRSFRRKQVDTVGKLYNVGLWYHLIKLRQLGYQREARNLAKAQSHHRFSYFTDELGDIGCVRNAV